MKRRLLSALLTVCMLLTMLPVTAFAADGSRELITFSYEDDGPSANKTVSVKVYVDSESTARDTFSVQDVNTTDNHMTVKVNDGINYEIDRIEFDGGGNPAFPEMSSDLKSYSFQHTWGDVTSNADPLELSVYLRTPLPKPSAPNGIYEGSGDVVFNLYQDQLLKMLYVVKGNADIDPDEIEDVTLHFTKNVGSAMRDSYAFYWADPTADYLGHYHITGRTHNTHGDVIPNNIQSITLTYEGTAVTIPADKLSCVLTSNVGHGVYEIKANDTSWYAVAFYEQGDSGLGNAGVFHLHDIVFVTPGGTVTEMPMDPKYTTHHFAGWSTEKSGGDPFNESYVVNSDMRVWAQKYTSDYSSSLIYVDNTNDAFLDRFVELCNAKHGTTITADQIKDSVKIQVNGINEEHTNPNYSTSNSQKTGWDNENYAKYTAYKIYNYDADPEGTDPNASHYNKHIPFDEIQSITIFADVTLNGETVTVSFDIDKGSEPGEFGAVVSGYEGGTGSIDGVFWLKMNQGEPDDEPVNPPEPTTPAITGFTKDLVDSAQDAQTAGITNSNNYDYPDAANNNKVIIPYGEEVTLLYAITVEGKGGTEFTVTDEGATLVSTNAGVSGNTGTFTGSIPEDATEITFYVSKSFGADDIEDGKLTNNANIISEDGVQEGEGEDEEETPAEEESYPIYVYVQFVGQGQSLTDDEKDTVSGTYGGALKNDGYMAIGYFEAPMPDPTDADDSYAAGIDYKDSLLKGITPYMVNFTWLKDVHKDKFDLNNMGWIKLSIAHGALDFDDELVDDCWHLDGQIQLYAPDIDVTKELTSVHRGDETITDDLTNETLEVGDQLTWTITVTNEGNKEATGLKLTDTLTANGEAIQNGATVTPPEGVTDMNNFSVAANDEVKFTATYTVAKSDISKTLTNTATVSDATGGGEEPDDPTDETENPVGDPKVIVTKTADKQAAMVGDTINYTITVTNNGDEELASITIKDEMWASKEYYPIKIDGKDDFVSSVDAYTLKTPVDPGDSVEITYSYTVTDADGKKGEVANKVTVTQANGEGDDSYLGDDETTVQIADVVITPADIVIYTGGTGYAGVTDANGDIIGSTETENGLPRPGYHIDLSDEVETWLAEKNVDTTQAADLAELLSFCYYDQDDSNTLLRQWNLVDQGVYSREGGTVTAYVYSLSPNQTEHETGREVRLQFTDNGKIITDDSLTMGEDVVSKTYQMTIYGGGLDQNEIQAVFTAGEGESQQTASFSVAIGTGELTVKSVTEEQQVNEIVSEGNAVDGNVITAVADENVKYYVNDSEVAIDNTGENANRVQLLVDDVSNSKEFNNALGAAATEKVDGLENVKFAAQYLDLVDTANGNAVVTLGDEQNLTLYWPVPSDAADGSAFRIVHYTDMDRESPTGTDDLASKNPAIIEGTRVTIGGKDYIEFETSSFSPFVLVYEGEGSGSGDNPGGNTGGSTGGGGGGGTTYYTLRYESNGGTEYDSERYRRNTVVELDKTPIREGYTFTGWYADKDLEGDPITEIKMTSNKTVYAGWEVTFVPNWLNGDDHFAYIIGRDSGLVEPQSSITRAEVATIFFRLLKDDVRAENLTESNAFTDVAADMWYNTAISTMAKMGILEGDPDGSFRPDDNITRAEFAAIAARFSDGSYEGADIFDDIADHWARNEINLAASVGWIAGYENGSFAPQRTITRAEAMTLINRVLQRLPETEDDLLDDMTTWPDVQPEAWYYLAVQEATNSHDFDRKDDGVHETWTELTEAPDWEQYQ